MTQQQINTDDTETLNKALRLLVKISAAAGDPEGKLTLTELVARIQCTSEVLAEIHNACGDPDRKLTSKQLLARINAMTVTLTALTSGEDHNEIINRVTNFAADTLK